MHFESLHFRSILILVPNLISCLFQSLKMKNHVHFGSCRQPINKKFLHDR